MPAYKNTRVLIDGTPDYIAGVTACLDTVADINDGKQIFAGLAAKVTVVTIRDTLTGNSCGADTDGAFPPFIVAIRDKNADAFKTQFNAAIAKAKSGGLTLEHFARQLSMGLTPASYAGVPTNVVAPKQKNPAPAGTSGQDVMLHAALQTASAIETLQGLLAGTRTVDKLPDGWGYDLPRLLRNYLAPGTGSGSTVNFNPTKTFHCEDDPAMHQRPPAVGLAHEMIHALHNANGVNMRFVRKDNETIEELITTGIPPYNFEDLSDNKLRTQWPARLELREHY